MNRTMPELFVQTKNQGHFLLIGLGHDKLTAKVLEVVVGSYNQRWFIDGDLLLNVGVIRNYSCGAGRWCQWLFSDWRLELLRYLVR